MADSYHELVIDGALPVVKGFVIGNLLARGLDPNYVLFAEEHGIECEGFVAHLAEWMRLHATSTHLLVPNPLHNDLKADIANAVNHLGLKIRRDRLIRSASFRFSYTAYSKQLALELDSLLKRFPDRVRISDEYNPRTSLDPQAVGVELYTPAHAYEVQASGTATGDLATILELRRMAHEHELMRIEKVRLHDAS